MAADVPVSPEHVHSDSAVDIDVGIAHLATTSAGTHIENIRPRSKRERELRIVQRALVHCKRDSKRRGKVKQHLAKIQRSIANVRSNHLHQVSADLASALLTFLGRSPEGASYARDDLRGGGV